VDTSIDVVDRLRDVPKADYAYRGRAELENLREQLRSARDSAYQEMMRLTDQAAGRPLTRTKASDYGVCERRLTDAGNLLEGVEDALIAKGLDRSGLDFHIGGYDPLNPATMAPDEARSLMVGSRDPYIDGRPITRSQTVTGFTRARGDVPSQHEELNVGKYLTGLVTGRWDSGSELERRALSEGVQSAGGYLVPTLLSSQIIDLARPDAQVMAAGAQMLPMANQTVDIAKWAGDPGSAWHTELATITPTDALMGRVRLTAHTLPVLTVVSRELVEDAPNVGTELAKAFAKSFAIKIDKTALYGSGVAPEPLGVKNTSGITIQSMGTNGAVLSTYDPFVDAVGSLEDANEDATGGIILAPRSVRTLNKLKDSTGQPLRNPPVLDGLPFLDTNQVPINLTQGSATTASDAFVADWSQLYIGVRTELMIQPLRERYADQGALGFLAWWRGDIAVARPAAFTVISGIL
jgi:HK97 family phage major capsid protein